MAVIKLFNTLGRELQEFKSLNPNQPVGLYSCGPTVYNYPHIGNYRAYIFADTLKRVLQYNHYQVKHIMNITDVDDKTIRDSQVAGKNLKEFTEFYTQEFFKDLAALNIIPANEYPKASDYITEMVAIISDLIKKDFAYKTENGDVYFRINKMPNYGQLARLKLDEQKTNAAGRIKKDEYDKDDVQDFALWKAWDEADGEIGWDSPFGKGRPGWHIECSAMSMKNLGETFDIHTGGVDNIFPHHENEIAQSECSTDQHFVNYWLHNEWILVDGKKMAKSAGNFFTLQNLAAKNISPLAYRYLLLTAHYRSQLNFTWEALVGAATRLEKLKRHITTLPDGGTVPADLKEQFLAKINNDLNTAQALALIPTAINKGILTNDADEKAAWLEFDKVFGLGMLK